MGRVTEMSSLEKAIDDVWKAFPFDNYLIEMAAHAYICNLVSQRLLPGGGRVLDVGAGSCDKTGVVARMGYECEACDDLEDPWHQLEDNRSRIRAFAQAMGVTLHEGKAEDLLPGLGPFDLVMLNDIIEHLHESPRDLLNLSIACLREGGWCVITMPKSVNLRKRLSVLFGRTNYPPAIQFFESKGRWRGHVREWTPAETGGLLRWMGLVSVTVETFHGMLGRKLPSPLLQAVYGVLTSMAPSTRDSICAWGARPVGWRQVRAAELAANPVIRNLPR